MKHVHILFAVLTIALFLYQFSRVVSGKHGQVASKGLKIGTHVVYTLLVLTGAMTLLPVLKLVGLPHWVIAKVVLLVVAVSATIKATRATTPNNQAKAGMLIALVAYIGIVVLAISKPMNLF